MIPAAFNRLVEMNMIRKSDIVHTNDGFWSVFCSLSDILMGRGVYDFPDSCGSRLRCDRFYDDWYLYAVSSGEDWVYGLYKLREQEFDAVDDGPADGDTPGITVSFIAFPVDCLLRCVEDPSDVNRLSLNYAINCVVAKSGQTHHEELKRYFRNPRSEGAYLIAELYGKHIASFVVEGWIDVPKHYAEICKTWRAGKGGRKMRRLPNFVEWANKQTDHIVCDHERLYIRDSRNPTELELAVILATHTGNVSVHSFAAEVEYHARFLVPWARFRIPLIGKSIYASAIRADMTIDDTEFEGPAPFYRMNSCIVRRQIALHPSYCVKLGKNKR